MRTYPVIRFVNETGDVVDTFDVYDAEYSFKRGLVQDMYGSPIWMFYKPLFDQLNSDYWDTGYSTDAMHLAHLIDDAIEVSGDDLIINVGLPFSDTTFKQILTQTWSSIISKEWAISKGCWNGDLFLDANYNGYPDWFEPYPIGWRHVEFEDDPINLVDPTNYAGTGPYYIVTTDENNGIVILQRNSQYWKGWPAVGRKSYLQRIEIHYISSWNQRKTAFLSCDLDICVFPRQYIGELLNQYGEPTDPKIKTIKNLAPKLQVDAAFFNFLINPESPYIGSGQFPDGIPTDFFNNTHTRKAFAYGFNHTKYIKEYWNGEAIHRETPFVCGLTPDYYSKGPDPPYIYDINCDAAETQLKQAIFDGASVWDSGFTMTLAYPSNSDYSRIIFENLRDFFAQLSTYDGRTGSPFTIIVKPEPWILYYNWWLEHAHPIFVYGWLTDFADADNFVRQFMHGTDGIFAEMQSYTAANGWGTEKDELIDKALRSSPTMPSLRADIYAELQDKYIADCPSIPLAQLLERRWQKYWVKGWYYNPLYPSDYYYHLYKENACWADVNGGPPNYIPDGVCSMRDIGYIAGRFRAYAPDTSKNPPYNPKWAPGVYGSLGADVYGDRKVDMRDIGFACAHFGDTTEP